MIARAGVAEFLGSAGLAAVVVGSGIAAQTLSPGDVGLALFENAFATALGLTVLILVFAPVSGAHFNPVVTLVDALSGGRPWRTLALYVPVQVAGCVTGAVLANAMFGVPTALSTTDRATWPHLLAEVVATAGLVLVIFALVRTERAHLAAPAVGAYIGAAYFFTSSTSFANPAITVGRAVSDTFAGIAPASVLPFIAAQLVGAVLAWLVVRALFPVADPDPAIVPDGTHSEAAAS
jgi:glycerol uptake facilitator-like aquaporin